jgi:hypothetical protein
VVEARKVRWKEGRNQNISGPLYGCPARATSVPKVQGERNRSERRPGTSQARRRQVIMSSSGVGPPCRVAEHTEGIPAYL